MIELYTVTVRATSIMVEPGQSALVDLKPLLDLHEYEDEYQDMTCILGYMYDEQHDTLYLHKGVDLEYIRRLLNNNVTFKRCPFSPYKEMKYQFEEVYPPKNDDQVDYIDFIAGEKSHASNINDPQIFLVAGTGSGKTFCTGYGIGLYGLKTLIVMHRDQLRSQWATSLHDLNGYSLKHTVHEIVSSAEVEAIVNSDVEYDYDIYLMTHATFRAGCKRIGDARKIGDFTKNLGIGCKVIDEAHLEFRDTLLMEFLLNVKRNLYLTATDGRSSKDENAIFKHVFSATTFYRKAPVKKDNQPDKWVKYVTVNINTHVKPNVYRFRVNGGRGMSAITYGKWVIAHDQKQTHFHVCTEILKEIYQNEPTAKVIVFFPLIDLCTDGAYFFHTHLEDDESFDYSLNIKTINSHNTKSENERNQRADVIVTTVQSLGTGTDIKGITDIICCSPMVSKIVVKQVIGRIRYINKQCHYFDIVDTSVPADVYWWKSRSRTLKSLASGYEHRAWAFDEGDESN